MLQIARTEPWERQPADIEALAEVLKTASQVFQEMEEESFLGLCKRVSVVQYPRGKLVLKQGRAVDEFMYLLKGNTGLTLTLILTLTAVSLGRLHDGGR